MSSSLPDPHGYDSDGDDEELLVSDQEGLSGNTSPVIPDMSPHLVELAPNEFPSYFMERGGRLFHSHRTSPYPLPADTPEQQRLNVTHAALSRLIGANYVGPVPDLLAPVPDRQKLVLDLCTGTGKWVMDMAREFPHALFRGFDIVPIATRYPPHNVQFEVHDVNSPYRWRTSSIDFVHARSVSMAVRDYPAVLQEVARILRPDGLFLSCEWGRHSAFHPAFNLDPEVHAPAACHFFEVLGKALDTCRGIQPIASRVPSFLRNSGCFKNIESRCFYMPIGPWHAEPEMKLLGRAFRASLLRYADSVKPLLLEAGWSEEEVLQIIGAYIHELKTVHGMVGVMHTVHARRL
ncbi:putative methyltransferase domain containing protein [Lyophyllum shimeji]|uniref:Methyltransferase domain containing protein n=1 Tax=Lyophyllum shimeji TaxID=47721 RepID=A0A9P3PZF7_LYOSH|nr:putative methyltransferase domain containing protein [Lyophyllum shimeji]